MEDAAIVDLYWQRSDDAIPVTICKYGGYCRTIATNILSHPEDAEECVNDTWLSAWNSMPTHRPQRLAPYLGKLTRWLSLNRLDERNSLKRGGGEASLALEELSETLDSGADVQRALERKELADAVNRFLETLTVPERRVFLARYWVLLPVKGIAARYDFTQGKVKSMLLRTRRRLGKFLKEEGLC